VSVPLLKKFGANKQKKTSQILVHITHPKIIKCVVVAAALKKEKQAIAWPINTQITHIRHASFEHMVTRILTNLFNIDKIR